MALVDSLDQTMTKMSLLEGENLLKRAPFLLVGAAPFRLVLSHPLNHINAATNDLHPHLFPTNHQ